MAIGPIELNGMLGRELDVSILKHNVDSKSMVDQSNMHNQFNQKLEHNLTEVRKVDDTDKTETKFDAKEKGSNEYDSNGNKKKKKNQDQADGKFVMKKSGGFDIKI